MIMQNVMQYLPYCPIKYKTFFSLFFQKMGKTNSRPKDTQPQFIETVSNKAKRNQMWVQRQSSCHMFSPLYDFTKCEEFLKRAGQTSKHKQGPKGYLAAAMETFNTFWFWINLNSVDFVGAFR